MEPIVKKSVLRMIENGVFVLTAIDGNVSYGSTITFVTQTSFNPSLIVVALRTDSGVYQAVKNSRQFALHMLGLKQKNFASAFFKPSVSDDSTINGRHYVLSNRNNPILQETIAYLECDVVDIIERGDHHVFLAEVVEAELRSDEKALALHNTGWTYGG